MKILILGAGQVGGTLAENLAREAFDVTLVDKDAERLKELRDRLDIQTIQGIASHPDVLRRAGADDASMLIAVTNSDEVNMVACQVCYSLYRTPTKIARVRAQSYHQRGGFFTEEHMPIDVLINPEILVTDQIEKLLRFPGTLQVLDFAEGKVQLVAVKAVEGGPLVGHELRFLREHMPKVDTRVVAIFRNGRPILPQGGTLIEKNDEVFFIADAKDINAILRELGRSERPNKRVVIAGGGLIGERLAMQIQGKYDVKVIEFDKARSDDIADRLNTLVLLGDATDRELLLDAGIENVDVFCALTNDDEVNIMSSMLAKRMGARQVIALINKPSYVDLVQETNIDIAISPQLATTSSLLTHVRRGDVTQVHSLRRGAAEAMETIAHGTPGDSKVVGRMVREIPLPPGTTIGALVRGDEVLVAHDDTVVENEDHVILFVVDKKRLKAVEKLFSVGLDFF
jgi:trk system potassium uptake protein